MKTQKLFSLSGLVIFFLIVQLKVSGQGHPFYLHALSDLRAARWMIDHRPTNDWQATTDEIEAVRRIDAAINEIKRASIDDGKDMYYHPQMDEHPDHAGRLHDALDLLRKAQQDVNQGEDYGPAQGLQQRAMIHINEAIRLTERTMAALMPQPDHPRYLQALSDLRVARWMIDHRSGDWQATEDEFAAVREIDAAINEIKRAAIDDRKDVNDHVGVDEHPGHMDRLRDAEFYLNKAQQDVNQDEDNRFADGLQARALQHINEAIRNTHRAIRQ